MGWSDCNVDQGKRKAVCLDVEGQLATQRFKRCLLVEVEDGKAATTRISSACGLGLRKSAVRSKPTPGCAALFLMGESDPAPPLLPFASAKRKEGVTANSSDSSSSSSSSPPRKVAKPGTTREACVSSREEAATGLAKP